MHDAVDGVQPGGRGRGDALPLPITLLVLGLAYWCVDTTSPALPIIRESLELSATGAGLVASLFFFGRLVANLPASVLVDRAGPRATAAVGAALLGVGSAAAALAPDEGLLLLARALQGGGVAFLVTAGLLSVLRALPKGGAAMTAFNVAAGLGGNFGLLAGGLLAASFGWPSVFWQCVALAAIVLAATAAFGSAKSGRRRDVPAREDALPPPRVAGPAVVAALLGNLLVYANYAVWVLALPLYAAARFGAGPADIGRLLLVINTIHLLGAVPVGGLIRLRGATFTLGVGLLAVAVGLGATLAAPNATWLAAPLALYALGAVAGNSAAGDLLLRLGGGGGRAVAMVRLTSDIGMVAGPAAAGVLADAAGVGAPFVALAVLSAGGAAAAIAAAFRGWRRAGW